MPAAVGLRTGFSAAELRHLAARAKNANQSRRLLSLAAIVDGMSRTEAARIGAHGPADLAGLGSPLQRTRPGGAEGQLVQGQPTAPVTRATVGAGTDGRDRSGSGRARRRALAPD